MALFTVMATTVSFSGCGDEEVPQAEERDDYENFAGDVLTDEAGREYKLHDNGDGTETARYANGDSVTFRRDEGGLSFLSGTAGLLAGLAAGYFIHRGLSGGHGGYYDANRKRYVASEPVRPLKRIKRTRIRPIIAAAPAAEAVRKTPVRRAKQLLNHQQLPRKTQQREVRNHR